MNLKPDYRRTFPKVQHMPNGRTPIYCIFIDAEVVELLLDDGARFVECETKIVPGGILLEIVGAEDNPKTERRWYHRIKDSVEYVIRNLGTLVFVWDKFRGM
ncbi:hypothetical protein DRQ25_17065 [Candidatus Fermentibacteria bacterium]|nr:MAG: hypothetical protein DRQ25_17065 [Candidatus Fermentibacteria bacterium]